MDEKQRADVATLVQEMVRRIVERFQPEQIILFGSHARGTAGPDSDVDLLVVLREPGSRLQKQLEIRVALHGMGIAKDIVVATPEDMARARSLPGTLIRSALREGRVLYERAA